ncbi:MAG: hypothetical protein KF713_18940 [Turneriella sp.]|nr:hypothetical protein [Turneriella sp.]
MSETFGVKRLQRIDDWIEVVTKRHYREGHSAYEVAQKWQFVRSRLPEPISSLLQESQFLELHNLEIRQLYAEFPVWLDTHSTPSKNDLMIFCEGLENRKITIALEAKCDESFANPVSVWLRSADKPTPRRQRALFHVQNEPVPRKLRRLAFLNEILSTNIGIDSLVRYQLLHRLASAILIARQTLAKATVMMVQAFSDSPRNFEDFRYFCNLLGFEGVEKDTVIGPCFTPVIADIPVYLIYVQDRRRSDPPSSTLFENSPANEAA